MSSGPKPQTRLLLCSREKDAVIASQGAVFREAGYAVVPAVSSKEIQEHIDHADFDLIVLNHTLSFADRKFLARRVKARNPDCGVLVLHHSGSLDNPFVDLAVDSRSGAQAMLLALRRAEAMLHARTRHCSGLESDCMVVADADRNYTFASDAACRLLGYDRAMFLELRIDDVVAGAARVAEPLFREFVKTGVQTGSIMLRHRSGRPIMVKYSASTESDGCLLARWEPIPSASD